MDDVPCFCASQETDNWTISAVNVLVISCTVVITAKQPICAHGRSIIFVVHGLTMRGALGGHVDTALTDGRDEEDYIEALEMVMATLTEGRKAVRVKTCSALTLFYGTACTAPNARVVARTSSLMGRKYDGCSC